jgi:RNA polymerase sigma-70 factor (ECF subfamily)
MPEFDEEFRRLFSQYFQSVFLFFLRRGFPREECRDLAQETFLRVYRSIGDFRRDASFQTWLFQIATNLWRNEVRRRMAEKREGFEVSLEHEVEKGRPVPADCRLPGEGHSRTALDGLLVDERKRMMREALRALPPQMRRCVLLRIDQNLKYREIAAAMQVSIDTVKSQISQAKDRLEIALGRYFNPSDLGEGS